MASQDIIILAGGKSAADCQPENLYKYGHVIGVNDSGLKVRCHTILSMDRLWMENNYETCRSLATQTVFRRCAWRLKGKDWPRLGLFDCNTESLYMNSTLGCLDGDNSGACALNLAYQMRPKRVFLFGFDMNGSGYWHDAYSANNKGSGSRKHNDWAKKFHYKQKQFYKEGILVFNVNTKSAIDAFEKINYQDFVGMI